MRIVYIASAIAVLLTTLAYAYMLYYFQTHAGQDVHNPVFITGMIVGIVVGIFSLAGAFLLFRGGR